MKNSYFLFKTNAAVIILLLFIGYGGISQTVGIGTSDPQTSLDIQGANNNGAVTATDGLMTPRVNSLGTTGTQNGQLVYLIADDGNLKKGFYNWNGTSWRPIILNSSPTVQSNLFLPDVAISIPPISITVNPNTPITNGNVFNTNLDVSGVVGNATLVTLSLDITHSWDGDLDIYLRNPSGIWLALSNNNGGSGDNFSNTTFQDSAPTNITAGTAPFIGSFQPEGNLTPSGAPVSRTGIITNLAGFNGINPNGRWVLRIGDNAAPDTGTLNSVTLTITGSGTPNWILIGETPITYLNDTANIVKSSYSADPTDLNGVITAITRTTVSAGAVGTAVAALPATVLNYASASPSGTGNFWVNTVNQTRDIGLVDNTIYFYQLWRKGNIETPVNLNETFSLVPMRMEQ